MKAVELKAQRAAEIEATAEDLEWLLRTEELYVNILARIQETRGITYETLKKRMDRNGYPHLIRALQDKRSRNMDQARYPYEKPESRIGRKVLP
jgi:hypothetical protein